MLAECPEADQTLKDEDDLTAYEVAKAAGNSECMAHLAPVKGGKGGGGGGGGAEGGGGGGCCLVQ